MGYPVYGLIVGQNLWSHDEFARLNYFYENSKNNNKPLFFEFSFPDKLEIKSPYTLLK